MATEIVKQHDVTQIDKLVATFSKLNPAATAAKWEELDGAVEKSIVAIDQKFDALGANLIKVRAFLSQMENPGRKNIIEGIVGFPSSPNPGDETLRLCHVILVGSPKPFQHHSLLRTQPENEQENECGETARAGQPIRKE